jgi:hypothetical protein
LNISVTVEFIANADGQGSTYILPTEEEIARAKSAAEKAANGVAEAEDKKIAKQYADALAEEASMLGLLREKLLPTATIKTYTLIKPQHREVKNAQVKYSSPNPVTGRVVVNEIAVMGDLFPAACSGDVPDDYTIAEFLERRLYEATFPNKERLAFLLSR